MKKLLCKIFIFTILVNPAFARQKDLIDVKSIFELQSQKAFESDDRDNEYLDTFGRNETYVNVNFTDNFKLNSALIFERIKYEDTNSIDSEYGNDRAFDGHGIYTEELKFVLTFDKGNHEIFAGKFNPRYGTAFNRGRGIWTHEFAQTYYEQTEKLGFGGFYGFKPAEILGKVRVGASLFHDDTKFFDGATISNRSYSKDLGEPGNNNDFGSFVISIDGNSPLTVKNLRYHISYLNLKTTDNVNNHDQNGFLVNIGYVYDLNKDITFDALIEHSKFNNFAGNRFDERNVLTANIFMIFKKDWRVSTTYSELEDDYYVAQSNEQNISLMELSFGHKFPQTSIFKNFSIDVGYKSYKENKIKTDSLGILTRYIVDF